MSFERKEGLVVVVVVCLLPFLLGSLSLSSLFFLLPRLPEMEEPKFYDVYIVDKSVSKTSTLTMYPVPIRVLNYDGNGGNFINVNENRADEDGE